MQIKKYLGKDVQDAILKVRNDLGINAIIINTRKVKQKGLLNLFSRPLIEVLAGIDNKPHVNSKEIKVKNSEAYKLKETNKYDNEMDILQNKVKKIEGLLDKIYHRAHDTDENTDLSDIGQNEITKIIQVFEKRLLENKVEDNIVKEIISQIEDEVSDKSSINDITNNVYKCVTALLGKVQPMEAGNNNGKPKIVAFVGPTGVGKTTTLAKIAAMFSINEQKKIGIISADTYRIAAVEQLRTYTEILGLPMKVIYSPEEISDSINEFMDKDMIFIDTAGRSHKNIKQFDELKEIIKLSNPDEVCLLISLTTNYDVCKDIIESYSFLKDYKIIFTKIDEASSQGMILNISKISNKKLSYITTGQSVPDDIEVLDINKVAKSLLGSIKQ